MRFMLEAAGIDSEGVAGAIKLQGLAFAWARIVAVWLDDPEPGLDKTMAELDRELTRGETRGRRARAARAHRGAVQGGRARRLRAAPPRQRGVPSPRARQSDAPHDVDPI